MRRGLAQAIKAFYTRVNDDGRTVAAMDVLAPRIGEIIGGSQREKQLKVLKRRHALRKRCALLSLKYDEASGTGNRSGASAT